jgi:two-component system osmolarity sensor histidine kinase EnvZ
MDTVWRPFQRVEGSRSPQTGGYGLGLAIVRQLATSQAWTVGLTARSGGGLDAWVELPAHAQPVPTGA